MRTIYRTNEYDLQSRVDNVRMFLTDIQSGHPCSENANLQNKIGQNRLNNDLVKLISDLGYEKRTIANKNYKDATATVYVRESKEGTDLLFEQHSTIERNSLSYLLYVKTTKPKKAIKNYSACLDGKQITLRYRLKKAGYASIGFAAGAILVQAAIFLLKENYGAFQAIGAGLGSTVGWFAYKSFTAKNDEQFTSIGIPSRKVVKNLKSTTVHKGAPALESALYIAG